jgi:chitinase
MEKDNQMKKSAIRTTLLGLSIFMLALFGFQSHKDVFAENETPTETSQSTQPQEANTVKSKKLVGYYAAWSAYSNYYPNQLDASKLTHINYAFANISTDLKVTLGYPDVDPENISF